MRILDSHWSQKSARSKDSQALHGLVLRPAWPHHVLPCPLPNSLCSRHTHHLSISETNLSDSCLRAYGSSLPPAWSSLPPCLHKNSFSFYSTCFEIQGSFKEVMLITSAKIASFLYIFSLISTYLFSLFSLLLSKISLFYWDCFPSRCHGAWDLLCLNVFSISIFSSSVWFIEGSQQILAK